MSKEPNNIDQLIREKLDGFEMTPPSSVWESTSASLRSERKKRFLFWFLFSCISIAMIGSGVYFYSARNSSNELHVAVNKTNTANKTTHAPLIDTNNADLNAQRVDLTYNAKEMNHKKNESNQTISIDDSKKSNNLAKDKKQADIDLNPYKNGFAASDTIRKNYGISTYSKGANKYPNVNEDVYQKEENTSNSQVSFHERNDNFTGNTEYNTLPLNDLRLLKDLYQTPTIINLEIGAIKRATRKRPLFSLEGSIGVSSFNNIPEQNSTDPQLYSVLRDASSNRQSMDVRLGLNYHLASRISLQTGIHYNSSSENYKFSSTETVTYSYNDTVSFSVDSVTMDTTYNVNTVFYDSSTVITKNERNTYKIFSLPFQVAWTQPISIRSSLEFALGGELSLFGENTGSTILDVNNSIPASDAYRTAGMLSLGGSIKYLYQFRDRHAVYIEPWVQFGLTNQNSQQLNYNSLRRRGGVRFGYRVYL